MKLSLVKYTLQFKFEAGTSRGILTEKDSWFIFVRDNKSEGPFGVGECGPLPGLSPEPDFGIEAFLEQKKAELDSQPIPRDVDQVNEIVNRFIPPDMPSLKFGLETAFLDLIGGGQRILFSNFFSSGKSPIPINGLIWMGEKAFMKKQIEEKLRSGYHCIKMKIGAIDFESECELLYFIRTHYPKEDLVLRVDANGAFTEKDALLKLQALGQFDLHSIEQPVGPGQTDLIRSLCVDSPVPIALDEELIGVRGEKRQDLLAQIKPQFIVLKPTLLGGLAETSEWIKLAGQQHIDWWITSALESNIGLNAISQYAAEMQVQDFQGLGTGQLYNNNIQSPLEVARGHISYNESQSWDLDPILSKIRKSG